MNRVDPHFRWRTTADGSLTLWEPNLEEAYHNDAGAYREALETFVLPSRALERYRHQGHLCVLDSCFGLGYNTFALLTHLLANQASSGSLTILAAEPDVQLRNAWPAVLRQTTWFALLQPLIQPFAQLAELPHTLVPKQWHHHSRLAGHAITLSLQFAPLQTRLATRPKQPYDLIFHDPFSWKKMPELWTSQLFQAYASQLAQHGAVVTYSRAPSVREALRQAGFYYEDTPAVGRKRGGTLAALKQSG